MRDRFLILLLVLAAAGALYLRHAHGMGEADAIVSTVPWERASSPTPR